MQAIKVFYSYAHEDKALRDELEKHLVALKRQGFIERWHDRFLGVQSTPSICSTLHEKVRALTPLPPLPWQPDQPESGPEQARLF